MITWKEHWAKEVYEGMCEVQIGKKTVMTYKSMDSNLYQALRKTAMRYPEKEALVNHDGKSYTYSGFCHMVDELATALAHKYHICKGRHVGMLLYNLPEPALC